MYDFVLVLLGRVVDIHTLPAGISSIACNLLYAYVNLVSITNCRRVVYYPFALATWRFDRFYMRAYLQTRRKKSPANYTRAHATNYSPMNNRSATVSCGRPETFWGAPYFKAVTILHVRSQ